jgi:anaerobic magnesium-protoporphyrin IX monomethyl ester cyclase
MKVVIIFPNLHAMPQTLDLGIGYLATYIQEKTHHEVKVIDVTFHRRHWQEHVRKQIEDFPPDVIGFSSFSVLWDCTRLIANDIFTYYKKVPVIVGGYQAIMCADETIQAKEVDAICTGEGEHTLTAYLNAIEKGESLKGILGIWYKDETGQIIKNANRPAIPSLDEMPFPNWDLFDDIDKYLFFLGRLYAIGTRGCPYKCSFCAEVALEVTFKGGRWRERDPIRYVDEIEYQYNKYKDRGMHGVHLFDTVFSFSEDWLKVWSAEYRRRGLHEKLPFTVFARPDQHNMSDSKIRILAESGCAQVRMGIEAGDSTVRLKELRKPGCTNDTILNRIQKLNENGIMAKTYSIIGFPHDNKESIWKTLKFADNPFVGTKFVLSYTPIPGTPMAAKVIKMHRDKNIQKYSFHFSGGVDNANYGPHYINLVLLWCYIYFGFKQAWLTFRASPIGFFKILTTRWYRGLQWGNPFLLTTLYALIHASFWPGIRRVQKNHWDRINRDNKKLATAAQHQTGDKYLPAQEA